MDGQNSLLKIQELTDIELALLLCLLANQHCIIETSKDTLENLEEELTLIATNVFGLSAAVIQCSSNTTLDDFSNGILVSGQLADSHKSPDKDQIFLSHCHDSDDGFANLEAGSEWVEDDAASLSSVVHRSIAREWGQKAVFNVEEIQTLGNLARSATISVEVKRYLHDILVFLRRHRAVAGGITPQATKHFELLARCLAPLHGLDFVTPSLVQLAARKIYRHRIDIVAAEDERSMQYGSDLAAVTALLEGLTAEDIIEERVYITPPDGLFFAERQKWAQAKSRELLVDYFYDQAGGSRSEAFDLYNAYMGAHGGRQLESQQSLSDKRGRARAEVRRLEAVAAGRGAVPGEGLQEDEAWEPGEAAYRRAAMLAEMGMIPRVG
ncbi:hypothetical protein MMC13_003430 [Lambiella insularis]|nr:hypothetical protein [Lambiella insularis]